MSNRDDLSGIVRDCIKMLDKNIDILSDVEYSFNSEEEDRLIPDVNKTDLIDMAHEVADSVKIKKAESSFMQRHLEKGFDF